MYERLGTFSTHLETLGKALNRSVGAYNSAVGSLERRVLPTARQFNRLGVVGESADEIPELPSLNVRASDVLGGEQAPLEDHPSLALNDLHLVEPIDETDELA